MNTLRLSLVIALAVGTSTAQTQVQPAKPLSQSAQPAKEAPQPAPVSLTELSTSLESLVNRVRPGVVQIFSTGYAAATDDSESTSASALLSTQHSTGTGVILSADGFIVTNAHVVRGARRIQVRLPPRLEGSGPKAQIQPAEKLIDAHLIGMDREMDVAVVKIDKTGLYHLQLGDSDRLRQGELVMAFGNPLGLQGSVSMGVVSSTSRQLHPDDLMAYIQTDAPINPGNSGGPLVDAYGRVVGMNTFILSQSGGSEGLGFAIPSNFVGNIYTQIRREGHVHRRRIGVHAQTITPDMATGLNLSQDWGAILGDVEPDGPADKAGVKIGDIVVSLNGRPIHNARQLELDIYRYPTRQKLALGLLRGTDRLTADVSVMDSEDDPQRFADMVNPQDNLVPRLGILAIGIDKKLGEMLPDLRHNFGVVVAAGSTTDLSSGTGLQPGDVIYSVNRLPVATVAALKKKLDEYQSGQPVVLHIERSGGLLYVTLELE